MIALHAGVMFCTEITDALWKRYLSQHPENLIDEDSSLLTFARAQSIRRKRHDSSGSQEGQNHQRLGRILSHRSTGGSFRLNRTGSTNRSLTESKTMPPTTTPPATTASRSKVKPRRTRRHYNESKYRGDRSRTVVTQSRRPVNEKAFR
ncbi:hypothetical protein OSTOST_19548 [Ostertagia ostertagi]